MPKLLTLEEWAAHVYETPPSLSTLRRWTRQGRIFLAPELHGKTYRLVSNAVYVDTRKKALSNKSLSTRPLAEGGLLKKLLANEQIEAKKRQ